MNIQKIGAFALSLLLLTGCQTKQGTGTVAGGAAGAVVGGIIGNIIGKDSKATAIGAAIGTAVGAGAGNIIGKRMDKVAAEAAAQVQNATVEEVTDANGLKAVKVTFDTGILFASNKATLNDKSKTELAKFSKVLVAHPDVYIDVYGHTDSTGNDGINIPLSNNRAQAVVTFLKSCGVNAGQFKYVVGKGSEEPVADNATSAGRQANRRVEVYLYAGQEMIDSAYAESVQ